MPSRRGEAIRGAGVIFRRRIRNREGPPHAFALEIGDAAYEDGNHTYSTRREFPGDVGIYLLWPMGFRIAPGQLAICMIMAVRSTHAVISKFNLVKFSACNFPSRQAVIGKYLFWIDNALFMWFNVL